MIRQNANSPTQPAIFAFTKNAPQNTSNGGGRIGPREKCDQVVYEAIAKAGEIIVRSRCQIPNDSSSLEPKTNRKNRNSNASSSSCRFNIEVGEVENVRNILQRWRRSLHVPLRVDVIYYDTHNDSNIQKSQQGELLERWCIDYVASSNLSHTPIDNNETITQLRQVCKRVVILLRSLHCLARMLPANRVYKQISSSQKSNANANTYYDQSQFQPLNGSIGFSIYAASQYINSPSGESSIETSQQFLQKHFKPVPTPFGDLNFSVLYHPKPMQSRPTRAIAIVGTKMESTVKRNSRNVGGDEGSDYRISDYDNVSPLQQSPIVSDYVDNKYVMKYDQMPFHDESDALKNEGNLMAESGRALSGLSLALMSQCQISSEELENKNRTTTTVAPDQVSKSYDKPSYVHTKISSTGRSGIVNMAQQCKSYDKPSHFINQARISTNNNHSRHNEHISTSVDNKPRSILSSNTVYSTSVQSPSPMLENDVSSRAGEYGYGYNGYNNIRIEKSTLPTKNVIFPGSSMKMGSLSPAIPLGSTPPLSHNMGSLGRVSPIRVNASPPFPTNPHMLIPPLQNNSNLGSTPPSNNVNSLQHILAPQASLEVLPVSPYKTVADSFRSSLSFPIPTENNETTIPLPFGGSFGSTHSSPNTNSFGGDESSNPLLRSLYKNNMASTTIDQEIIQPSFEDMPFATDSSPDASSYSIHTAGETCAASSFAHRCATASRLQLFNSTGNNEDIMSTTNSNHNINQSSKRQNIPNSDVTDQLNEFRNFGASLLRMSAHSNDHTNFSNGSGEMQPTSNSATPTPVA